MACQGCKGGGKKFGQSNVKAVCQVCLAIDKYTEEQPCTFHKEYKKYLCTSCLLNEPRIAMAGIKKVPQIEGEK